MDERPRTSGRPPGGALRLVAGMAALAAAAAATLAACGKVTPDAVPDGGGGAGGADAAPEAMLTAAEACDRQGRAICDALKDCAEQWMQFLYGDETTCIARTVKACTEDQAAPGVTRTIAEIATCADDVTKATCANLRAARYPASCGVKPGTRMNTVDCGSNWQCQSSYCAKRDTNCGMCAARAAAGEACTVDDGCLDGMKCANNKCAVPGDEGATCKDPDQPCRADLYCPSAGKCTPKLGANGTCSDAFFTACDVTQGYLCNLFTCQQVRVAKTGEACGGGSSTVCMGLNPCTGEMSNVPGVCAGPAADDAACGSGGDQQKCLPPAVCVSGTCRFPSGASCR